MIKKLPNHSILNLFKVFINNENKRIVGRFNRTFIANFPYLWGEITGPCLPTNQKLYFMSDLKQKPCFLSREYAKR